MRLPNWLGDALMARPLLAALRAAWPRARVTAAGPAPLLELLAPDRAWDDAEPLPGDGGAAARLRRAAPDLALVCPPSFASALFAWRSGARRRLGWRGDARAWLLTDAPPRPRRGELHLSGEYLALGAQLGVAPAAPPPLAAPQAARAAAGALAGAAAYAVLAPGAAYGPAKRWPEERFVAVGRALGERGLAVRVCGTDAERGPCERVAAATGGASLAGRTPLPVLAAVCAAAAAAVCTDSGLAHLAAATGAPTVAVFGSTSSAWTAPLGPRVRVVQRAPVCAPCFQRACRIGYTCLEAVSAAAVLRAVDEARAPAGGGRAA